MTDSFVPRVYQRDVSEAVLTNTELDRRLTIGLAAPGVGKQNAAIYTAIQLAREGCIDLFMTFVPRLNLAGQYELDYEGKWVRDGRSYRRDLGDALSVQFEDPRLNHLEHRPNADPLIPPHWRRPFGIVACYASLVKDMAPGGNGFFRALARQYEGRFLLHADEAQFCGAAEYGEGDAITGGVRAGAYIEELHRHSFHTLLQTGTETRADRQQLVLCEDRYGDPGKGEIYGPLIPDAECGYGPGRELGYLREFEIDYINDHVDLESLDGAQRMEYEIAESPKYLGQILRRERVWQPICDKTVERLRERQMVWPGYKGLICCMDQNHAEDVRSYLRMSHPGLRVLVAISKNQGEAQSSLRRFRQDGEVGGAAYDLLITVRMAFIGYDCKPITVVGVLTNYRDKGHLFQQAGRALRVIPGREYAEQVCWIVAPKDPQMCLFIDWLKEERKKGTHGGGGGPGPGEAIWRVRDAYATDTTADSLAGPVDDPGEYEELERLRQALGIYEPVTKLKRLADALRGQEEVPERPGPGPDPGCEQPDPEPKTSRELIQELSSQVRHAGKEALTACSVFGGDSRYGDAMGWFYDKVAALSYYKGDVTTPERAQERLDAAEKILAEVLSRRELWW